MQQIDFFLFDLGNVIIDIELEATPRALMQLVGDDVDPMQAERDYRQLERSLEVGAISEDAFINGILRHARAGTQAIEVIRAWNAMLIDIPRTRLHLLEKLNEHVPVYIVSNTNVIHIRWVRRSLKETTGDPFFPPRYARASYYSHDLGLRKPDREIFRHIIDDSGIIPERTLYLDDTLEHVKTALKMGFQAVQLPPEIEWAEWMESNDLLFE